MTYSLCHVEAGIDRAQRLGRIGFDVLAGRRWARAHRVVVPAFPNAREVIVRSGECADRF